MTTLKVLGHLAVSFFVASTASAEVIHCLSTQTSYEYEFDIGNAFVEITDAADGSFVASAEVDYKLGTGEDILYTVSSQGREIGIIGGEEGIRANFSHSIFESRLIDRGLECSKVEE